MHTEILMQDLRNCLCGHAHTTGLLAVEISEGCTERAAYILKSHDFPRRIVLAAQSGTLRASGSLPRVLSDGGFAAEVHLFDTMTAADPQAVRRMAMLCRNADGVLAVGSGTLCDVCRRAVLLEDKAFAIYATAPSMDGFASDTAPILQNGFKVSLPARQPSVLIADTAVLAAAPQQLKRAGFGDMLAKSIALAEWRIAHCLTGEFYCEAVAARTREAAARAAALADRIAGNDPHTAGILMESLVWTGHAMHLCGSSRPAGGAEHVVSHFWESMQTVRGEPTALHGSKVGAATGMIARLYDEIVQKAEPGRFCADRTDWTRVFTVYGKAFEHDVRRLSFPPVTQCISPALLQAHWDEICRIVREEIPRPETVDDLLRRAGAPQTFADVGVDETLGLQGLEFHPYMRRRILLSRLIPMLGFVPDYRAAAAC